jgi:hypothetical protein
VVVKREFDCFGPVVSQRLEMGHYTRVTQAISRVARRPTRTHKTLKRKLTQITEQLKE